MRPPPGCWPSGAPRSSSPTSTARTTRARPSPTSIGGVFAPTDVTDTDQVIAAVEAAKELGPLRALVNCAGIGWATRTIGKDGQYASAHDLDIFKKVVEINLVGTFNCIRLAATAMSAERAGRRDGERGAIVNMASVAAFDGQIGQASYSASKGGVVGMTLPIARDLCAVGIRVNCIAPGLIDTPIYGRARPPSSSRSASRSACCSPSASAPPRSSPPSPLELLCNSYMNAETIRIDGGIRMQPK